MNVSSNATFNNFVANNLTLTTVVSTTQNTTNLNVANSIAIGANAVVNTSQITVGNSTVNTIHNVGGIIVSSLNGNIIANSTVLTIGQTNISNGTINIGATSINTTFYTGNVFWANVSGRPTNVSTFTNDLAYANATNLNNINGTANSANFINGIAAANVVSNSQLSANLAKYAALSGATFTGGIVLSAGVSITANGTIGAADQILTSNGTATYWKTLSGTVTSVGSGNGLTGGPITSNGTLAVLANSGIISNATGVYVNTAYIGTLNANNASYLGGVAAVSYANSTANFSMSGNIAFNGTNNYFATNLQVGNIVMNATSISISNSTFGNSVYYNRYVSNSTVSPSGGVDGDIWIQYIA